VNDEGPLGHDAPVRVRAMILIFLVGFYIHPKRFEIIRRELKIINNMSRYLYLKGMNRL